MIGVDTNVLVRYIVQDDPFQSDTATRFFESELSAENKGFVTSVVLCEVAWVLARTFKLDRIELSQVLERLLGANVLAHEDAHSALIALREFRTSRLSFADCLIAQACKRFGCTEIVTFDANFSRRTDARLLG